MDQTNAGGIDILLVEDEKFHQIMAKRFLDKGLANYRLHYAQDGAEALDYLHKRGSFSAASTPDLVLLDLGLPKVSGLEVFSDIKNDEELKNIPVIVLTGCDPDQAPAQIKSTPGTYQFTKWMEMKEFMDIIRTVQEYRKRFFRQAA